MIGLENIRLGFAMCGSFCTFKRVIEELEKICPKCGSVIPIMSEVSYSTDTRFGKAEDFIEKIKNLTNNEIIKSVKEAEPIGPKGLLDVLVIAPCTGNTLAKLAQGIADSSVTMAAKAHLRNQKPLIIAVSTNDGLGTAAKNIGHLMNCKNVYLVPFGQDDCKNKPNSLVADMTKIEQTIKMALEGKQLQPVLC